MENTEKTKSQTQKRGSEIQFRVNESDTVEIAQNQEKEKFEAERTSMRAAIIGRSQYDSQIGRQHPLRILLAEDSMVNIKIVLWFLKKLGYRADVAFNGSEVLDALKRRSYDVILMDAEMPGMDGREATIQIRKDMPSNQQPHIVAMTANTAAGDKEQFLAIGMNDYITKPIKIEDLVRVLLASKPLPAITARTLLESDNDQTMLRVA